MLPRLHLVTDDEVLANARFGEIANRLIQTYGERVTLHLRGHGTSGAKLFALAETLSATARQSGAMLVVNDRVDVALVTGAHGVQLGKRSLAIADARRLLGADAWIGYSAHSVDEAAQAEQAGADFLLVGTIFPSASHPDGNAAGVELIAATATEVSIPIHAIGGITPERVRGVLAAGATGVAVLGGVWRAEDAEGAVGSYLGALA